VHVFPADDVEVDHLRKVFSAAKRLIDLQCEIGRLRRNEPESSRAAVIWMAEREDLAEQSEQALCELADLTRGGIRAERPEEVPAPATPCQCPDETDYRSTGIGFCKGI
jgi:hypothetical protein